MYVYKSTIIAAFGAMVTSNGPLSVQGFQTQFGKPSITINHHQHCSSSPTIISKRPEHYNNKKALFAVPITADDLPTNTNPKTAVSRCPFAFCHGIKDGAMTKTNHKLHQEAKPDAPLIQTKSLAFPLSSLSSLGTSNRVHMLNFKRTLLTFIARGLLLLKSVNARNQQLPRSIRTKGFESKLSQTNIHYIETLFDIICENDPLLHTKLPAQHQKVDSSSEFSVAFKLNFVAQAVSERFHMKTIKNIVPTYHSEYDQGMRDFINTFLVFASGITYEQVLEDPKCTIRALQGVHERQHHFHEIALSTFSSEYVDKPVKNQKYLALKHQRMGVSPTSFQVCHDIMKSAMVDVVEQSQTLSKDEKAALVEYFTKRFTGNDTTRIGVIHESYHATTFHDQERE